MLAALKIFMGVPVTRLIQILKTGLFHIQSQSAKMQPASGLASNIAILVLTTLGLVLNFKDMIALGVMGLAASQNFGIDVITYLMVIAVVGLVVLMLQSGELGKRAKGNVVESS